MLAGSRAATFTRVNGTVLCFCNKRLQNKQFHGNLRHFEMGAISHS